MIDCLGLFQLSADSDVVPKDQKEVLRLRGSAPKHIRIKYMLVNNNVETIELEIDGEKTFEDVKFEILNAIRRTTLYRTIQKYVRFVQGTLILFLKFLLEFRPTLHILRRATKFF